MQSRWSRARRSAPTIPAKERWILNVGCQGVFGLRGGLAKDVLKVTPDKLHVLTGNVGGSFGMKAPLYPEYVCAAARRQDARPAGEMDRRALGELPLRPSRPRPRAHCRAGPRQGRQDPRRAPHRLRQCRRLSSIAPLPSTTNAVKNVIGVYRTPLIEVNSRMRLHQHDAGRRLSRRRPARGQLLHGAADRYRGRARWASTARAAPAQSHRARADAYKAPRA